MWETANWQIVVMVAMALITFGLLIAYLFKTKAIGKAEVEIGTAAFTAKLKLQSSERHITERDFNLVNLKDFYAESGIGYVIRNPISGEWAIKKARFSESLEEKGFTKEAVEFLLGNISNNLIENPDENIHSLVIRKGAAQLIKYTPETIINGRNPDLDIIESALQGGQETIYDQVVVVAYDKDKMKRRIGLLDLFFMEARVFGALGPKRLHVNFENTVFVLDCSAFFGNIEYNGELGDHIINNMALFQENEQYFLEVFLTYVQSADKPTKVWDDLRDYLASFRVLKK